jgi:hypothetical protein
MSDTSPEFEKALDGVANFFAPRQTRAGVVARRLLGISKQEDQSLTGQLVAERRRRTRLDGSVPGWVVATTWSAWELLQLGCPPDHLGVSRMIGYVLARQDQAGRFGEGCSERRHAIGLCQHFLSGFFSPGSTDETLAPLTFPSGTIFIEEWDARFAASCFALRTVLQAREERRPAVIRHLDSLIELAGRWERGELAVHVDLLFAALSAIAMAPLQYRQHAEHMAHGLVQRQGSDGTWPNATLWHALDALLSVHSPDVKESIRRAMPRIVGLQRPDGSFDDTGNEEIALIALRALRTLETIPTLPRPRPLKANLASPRT